MHKSKYIAMVAATAMALTLAGCGSKGGELIEVTPTPMATPTPTVVPENFISNLQEAMKKTGARI